ncbi:MAG: ATP-dependent zinc protease [Crocinitomicaceae bacterium]
MKADKTLIGRWDYADFPGFQLTDVPVKIDTGAFTSSLRCSLIEEIVKDGTTILRYTILDQDDPIPIEKRTFETGNYTSRVVRNSGGEPEKRFSVETTVHIFEEDTLVEFTLAKRHGLRFPVLLGRKFLGNRFLIDPSKTRLSHKSKKKRNH